MGASDLDAACHAVPRMKAVRHLTNQLQTHSFLVLTPPVLLRLFDAVFVAPNA